MSIGIAFAFANTNTASSDTVLKPLARLIALRRYTEDSILLFVPTENASDHIGQEYSIIDVTTAAIILLLKGPGPPIFGIILASARCVTDAFSPTYFTCTLKFNLSSISVCHCSQLFVNNNNCCVCYTSVYGFCINNNNY